MYRKVSAKLDQVSGCGSVATLLHIIFNRLETSHGVERIGKSYFK